MPYIPRHRRKAVEGGDAITVGELNYRITKVCLDYLDIFAESYHSYNEVVGVLECVKHELMRRKLDEYEDLKCEENGDVY